MSITWKPKMKHKRFKVKHPYSSFHLENGAGRRETLRLKAASYSDYLASLYSQQQLSMKHADDIRGDYTSRVRNTIVAGIHLARVVACMLPSYRQNSLYKRRYYEKRIVRLEEHLVKQDAFWAQFQTVASRAVGETHG